MNDKIKQTIKMKDDANQELMRLYGDFIIHFEFVCSKIRYLILCILYPNNNIKQRNIVEIMTEGLTAEPLRKKMLALIIENYSKDSEIYKTTEKISSIFLELIEIRNSFAHGTAFIGQYDFLDETKDETITIRHPKIKRNGLDLNFKSFDNSNLQELIKCLFAIDKAISSLSIIISYPDKDKKWYATYHSLINNELNLIDIKVLTKKK